MEIAKKRLIYLYCITTKVPKLKNVDGLACDLSFVYCQGLYAVVGKVSEAEFGEENLKKNLADLEWIKVKASLHEKVIEGIMKSACVIPFKFGTIFNGEGGLKAMFGEHAEEFKQSLRNLEHKEEWGLKIYCELEKLKEAVVREEPEILEIDNQINSSSPGKAFLLKKKKEELIKNALHKRVNECGQKSFEILKDFSVDTQINKLLPKEVTERKDDMILNSAFLLNKSRVAEFIQAAGDLKAKYNDRGISFDCTGPWPPYNFCKLSRIGKHNG